jgi:hypothetical protein
MINHFAQSEHATSFWGLNPHCLIDRFLDYIEGLRSLILPAQAEHLRYLAGILEATS